MNRQLVASSNIKSISWERTPFTRTDMARDAAIAAADLGVLEVEFFSGDVYRYADVPRVVSHNVIASPSIGAAFHALIRLASVGHGAPRTGKPYTFTKVAAAGARQVTVVCGGCYGSGEIKRHGEADVEACGMCGGRGHMVVSEQAAVQTGAETL